MNTAARVIQTDLFEQMGILLKELFKFYMRYLLSMQNFGIGQYQIDNTSRQKIVVECLGINALDID